MQHSLCGMLFLWEAPPSGKRAGLSFRFLRSIRYLPFLWRTGIIPKKELTMKILISACLLGENCKYSGGNNRNPRVLRFVQGHELVPVCPEVLGGLPTPRPPAEIVEGRVCNCAGQCVDEAFRLGAQRALQAALDAGASLAILQSRSPSCGVKQIYDGSFRGRLIAGQGVFAKLLTEQGFSVIDAEDVDAEGGPEQIRIPEDPRKG